MFYLTQIASLPHALHWFFLFCHLQVEFRCCSVRNIYCRYVWTVLIVKTKHYFVWTGEEGTELPQFLSKFWRGWYSEVCAKTMSPGISRKLRVWILFLPHYFSLSIHFMSIGGSPYPAINAREIAKKLQQGYRMPKPKHVDEQL